MTTQKHGKRKNKHMPKGSIATFISEVKDMVQSPSESEARHREEEKEERESENRRDFNSDDGSHGG